MSITRAPKCWQNSAKAILKHVLRFLGKSYINFILVNTLQDGVTTCWKCKLRKYDIEWTFVFVYDSIPAHHFIQVLGSKAQSFILYTHWQSGWFLLSVLTGLSGKMINICISYFSRYSSLDRLDFDFNSSTFFCRVESTKKKTIPLFFFFR